MNSTPSIEAVVIPADFRRLRWDELVGAGDFVADEKRGLEPWEGPSGFRADAFVKPIYRRDVVLPAKQGKPGKTG